MTAREAQRGVVLNQLLEKRITVGEAASLLELSERQVRRLLGAYRAEGAAALVHGNRGRQPAHTLPQALRERVVALAQGPYDGANDTHLTELLEQREGLVVSRSSVRRVLRSVGIRSPRQRRTPKHRRRRERYPQEGMLLQVDGSRHRWLGEQGPWLTLVAAIDDATGTVPAGVFREQEDTHGYLLVLREVLQTHGVPQALYSDRHSIFQRTARDPETLEEQLAGERRPTQLGEALAALGISLILAHSPQAKGRVERLWGTLQSRLVLELRLAGATTLEEANRVLRDFLPRFNARFGVPAADPGRAYRALPPDLDLAAVLCFKYWRTVAADNTVRLGERTIQLLPTPHRSSYARTRVELQERLDGRLVVCHQGAVVATQDAPRDPVTLRGRKQRGHPGSRPSSGLPDGAGPRPEGPPPLPRPSPRLPGSPRRIIHGDAQH